MMDDPVCGMKVDEEKASQKSTYRERTYVFCGPGCKTDFDRAPEKYVESSDDRDRPDADRRAGQ